jgi:hypothetical protein
MLTIKTVAEYSMASDKGVFCFFMYKIKMAETNKVNAMKETPAGESNRKTVSATESTVSRKRQWERSGADCSRAWDEIKRQSC